MFNEFNLTQITPAHVERVYSGKQGCMCGCNGKYSNRSAQIAKVLKLLQDDPRTKIQDGKILYIDRNDKKPEDREYVVFLKGA